MPPKLNRRLKRAAKLLSSVSEDVKLKVPEAMRAKGYSDSEARDRSLQQQVRRLAKKLKSETIPIPPSNTLASSNDTNPTKHTDNSIPTSIKRNSDQDLTSNISEPQLTPPPKFKQIQKTSVQAQQCRVNKLKLMKYNSKAHKQATTWYSKEVQKGKEGIVPGKFVRK